MADAIGQAVNVPFEVLDAESNVVATGTSNGDAVSLPTGTYSVRLRSNTSVENTATIAADKETLVNLD